MSKLQIIFIIIFVILILGLFILPLLNRWMFNKLPRDQKIRILIKGAKSLAHFKNVSNGNTGILYFIKNKRKIIYFPWILADGQMICTRKNPFDHWDYPEEEQPINDDELVMLKEEIANYNKKSAVKIVFPDE